MSLAVLNFRFCCSGTEVIGVLVLSSEEIIGVKDSSLEVVRSTTRVSGTISPVEGGLIPGTVSIGFVFFTILGFGILVSSPNPDTLDKSFSSLDSADCTLPVDGLEEPNASSPLTSHFPCFGCAFFGFLGFLVSSCSSSNGLIDKSVASPDKINGPKDSSAVTRGISPVSVTLSLVGTGLMTGTDSTGLVFSTAWGFGVPVSSPNPDVSDKSLCGASPSDVVGTSAVSEPDVASDFTSVNFTSLNFFLFLTCVCSFSTDSSAKFSVADGDVTVNDSVVSGTLSAVKSDATSNFTCSDLAFLIFLIFLSPVLSDEGASIGKLVSAFSVSFPVSKISSLVKSISSSSFET